MGASIDGLKDVIEDAIRETRETPPLTPTSLIRVSGLAGLCAREEVLCARAHKVRHDVTDADLMLIFEHGNGLHWDLQNRILPATKTLFGRWLCGECGARHGGQDEWTAPLEGFDESQILRPVECPKCGKFLSSANSLYQEQWIKAPEFRLAGHPDGFLRMRGMPGLGVLEIKSIGSRGAWEVRNCAKLDHVVQAQTYMWMTGCRWGLILYWDKGTTGRKGLIEHIVEYDEDQVEAIQTFVRGIWAGIEGGKLPDRICDSPNCKRADLCSSVEACFKEID